ncbi:MAG: aldehyde ferredoxin oxidoreductase family protein [Ignisphaera sp.]|nr:aldehyde ferredoxin oxidoreductase family protein [Ignisphaera sp.]MCX8168369.1 aldehyde ferredoxin oxidoreductase family protein [Ignisphaera sp.]MDW8086182.1 aldehyde ferredoxin oxidoreductase family protein [Ignisphaera sp.]
MQPKGYTGRILFIDLTKQKYVVKPLEVSIAKQFIGGSGLAAYLLWNMLNENVHPLSPDNVLVVATGPATGALAPSAGRFMVASKSPITGIWGESHAGGFFGPEIKYAGYDAIVITGRSSEPVSLIINDDEVTFYRSQHLWGLDTRTATNIILDSLGRDLHVMVIGPAGENMVKFASIMVDYYRALGRTGMGAVMGSKNLKAIAVRGSRGVEVHNPDEFTKVVEEFLYINTRGPWALPAQLSLGKYGTPNLVSLMNAIGRLPTKNHWTGYWEHADKISGEALLKYRISRGSCFSCMIMCKHITMVGGGKYAGTVTGGPEYESLVSLGSNLLIDNAEAVIYMNQLCNLYGLDTISTGKVISFLFECYERGLVSEEELRGLKPTWGNEETAIELIKMITYRQGIGNVLAEGVARAARIIGRGSEYYALHVKGLEVSAQDPRAHKSVGVTWATSVRGADHLRSLTTVDELGYRDIAIERFGAEMANEVCNRLSEGYKGVVVKDQEDLFALVDSVIMCKYGTMWPPMYYFDFIARLLYPLTGIEEFSNVKHLREAAERIVNLKRCFNLREGIGKEYETIPKRFTSEPMPTGPAKGHVCNLEPMLKEYYLYRRWDYNTGLPYGETLEELGLNFVLVELEKRYSLPRRGNGGSS